MSDKPKTGKLWVSTDGAGTLRTCEHTPNLDFWRPFNAVSHSAEPLAERVAEVGGELALYRHRVNPERVLYMAPDDFARRTDREFWMRLNMLPNQLSERVANLEKEIALQREFNDYWLHMAKPPLEPQTIQEQIDGYHRDTAPQAESEVAMRNASDAGKPPPQFVFDPRSTISKGQATAQGLPSIDVPQDEPNAADEWNAKHKVGDWFTREGYLGGWKSTKPARPDDMVEVTNGASTGFASISELTPIEPPKSAAQAAVEALSKSPAQEACDRFNAEFPVGTEAWWNSAGSTAWKVKIDGPAHHSESGLLVAVRINAGGTDTVPIVSIFSDSPIYASGLRPAEVLAIKAKLRAAEQRSAELETSNIEYADSCKHWRERAEKSEAELARIEAATKRLGVNEWFRRALIAEQAAEGQ